VINGMQHFGKGTWKTDETYSFYKKFFGYKIKLNDLTVRAKAMEPVVGSVEKMRMMMAANAKGGAIVEIVEHKSSPIRPYPVHGGYGSYGILEVGFGVRGIEKVAADFKSQGVNFLTPICELDLDGGRRWRYTYLEDPDGLRLQLVEDIWPNKPEATTPEVRGAVHIGIGVSNLERSTEFYQSALGFDRLVYEFEGYIQEMDPLTGGALPMKLAILERSALMTGPISILPSGTVKLFEVPGFQGQHIYKGRRWGDIGCMELCMDVTDLEGTVAEMEAKGIAIYLPPVEMDMGTGCKGMVAYVRDPDGTIVEFVEIKTVAWVSAKTFMYLAMPLLKLYDRFT